MLKYILDQSHWNGRCYFPVAKQAGAIATFIRFGSISNLTGVPYSDYLLEENTGDAIQNDFPFGAYFYMRPRFDGVLQGNFYVNLLDKYKHVMKLPAVIDVKAIGDYRNIISMFSVLRNAGYKNTMLYTRQEFWDYNIPADAYWFGVPLWDARWTSANLTSPWSDGRFAFRDFPEWKYWQYSADGNGRAGEFGFFYGDPDVDLSYYNGTLNDFKLEYGIGNIITYPEFAYIVVSNGLRIREKPSVDAKILGLRQINDVVVPIDFGGGNFWVRDEKGWSAINYGGETHMRKA